MGALDIIRFDRIHYIFDNLLPGDGPAKSGLFTITFTLLYFVPGFVLTTFKLQRSNFSVNIRLIHAEEYTDMTDDRGTLVYRCDDGRISEMSDNRHG